MGLSQQADRPTATLSHGMQQRLSLARAMVHNPRILLLDEPFAGLDTAGQGWLSDWLRWLRDCGTTVCLATHDLIWAQHHADRVLRVEAGKLAMSRSIRSVPLGQLSRGARLHE